MLSHDSIMNLCRVLSERDGRLIGVQLGVPEGWTARAKDECDGDILRTNFRVLCEWRGKAARAAMVDFLISSLKTIGRNDLSAIVSDVYKNGRGLSKEDFDWCKLWYPCLLLTKLSLSALHAFVLKFLRYLLNIYFVFCFKYQKRDHI